MPGIPCIAVRRHVVEVDIALFRVPRVLPTADACPCKPPATCTAFKAFAHVSSAQACMSQTQADASNVLLKPSRNRTITTQLRTQMQHCGAPSARRRAAAWGAALVNG